MIPAASLKRAGLLGLLSITVGWGFGIAAMPRIAHAGGADPFMGEIVCGGFNYCPMGHMECNGQTLNINQNAALYSLIGTIYGGNGTTTFALPNIVGRTVVHQGQGTGLTNRTLGSSGGAETVQLTTAQIPSHSHTMAAHTGSDRSASPTSRLPGPAPVASPVYTSSVPNVLMAAGAVENSGASVPHNNRQPYLAVKCCIAIQGIYPPRQ